MLYRAAWLRQNKQRRRQQIQKLKKEYLVAAKHPKTMILIAQRRSTNSLRVLNYILLF